MLKIKNIVNQNVRKLDQKGPFTILEHVQDLSVSPMSAQTAYYASKMNVRRRQVFCELAKGGVTVQAGAMQWMAGNVKATTGLKGVGDLLGKSFRGKVTGESAVKPEYVGDGFMMLEPTTKHLLLIDLAEWNGSIVVEDGMFLACESRIKQQISARTNLSSAVAGGEGLFNLKLVGQGVVVLESYVPMDELVVVDLQNDELKIDGNFAIAWSSSLNFTVERAGTTLVGSVISGEGLVSCYKGTGRVLMAPVQ